MVETGRMTRQVGASGVAVRGAWTQASAGLANLGTVSDESGEYVRHRTRG
jgi:hypothetical protein